MWMYKNAQYLSDGLSSGNHEFLHRPEIVNIDSDFGRTVQNEWLHNWLKSRIDTSITASRKGEMVSGGTIVSILDACCVNLDQHDIAVRGSHTDRYALCETSHHDLRSLSWILHRNGVRDLENYLRWMKAREYQIDTGGRVAFIINTRWSAHNFYHWIHECLPRLVALKEKINSFDELYCIWGGRIRPSKYHIEIMGRLGISPQCIRYHSSVVSLSRLLHCSFVHTGSVHPKQSVYASSLLNAVATESLRDLPSRFFIFRKQDAARSFANNEDIAALAKYFGFAVLYLEDFKLGDQVRLFKNADIVVGAHGAGLVHIVNMRPTCRLIEIMPSDSVHPIYSYLASAQKIWYYCLVARSSGGGQKLHVDRLELSFALERALL